MAAAVLWAGRQAIIGVLVRPQRFTVWRKWEQVIELYPRDKVRAGVKVRRLSLSDRPRTRHLEGFVVTHLGQDPA